MLIFQRFETKNNARYILNFKQYDTYFNFASIENWGIKKKTTFNFLFATTNHNCHIK